MFMQVLNAKTMKAACLMAICAVLTTAVGFAQEPQRQKIDLAKNKTLYVVGYAHLDSQWRWDYQTTIDQYIKNTLEQNFAMFEKYPEYVFNFTGSVRYEMIKEYYPEHYEKLKEYIAQGRWQLSGSSVDEGDVNNPSAESVIRQVLYGNAYFRQEFGKESIDYMLPDCFGFPATMPSIWAHCGVKGFSTQKLTWSSAVGIPFNIGVWEGLDGNSVIAALNPGSYSSAIRGGRADINAEWVKRVNDNGEKYGIFADYHYYGVGDVGGAPRENDIKNYIASMGNPDSQIDVKLVPSGQLYEDITPEMRAKLPRFKGDMLLTEHSAGTLTSQAYIKRWNRKNEQLADSAERAAVIATWLGARPYPQEKLNRSWTRTLASQMHDILPGTSIPKAYEYSWNDEVLALNGFAAVLEDSVAAASLILDTNVQGQPLIVYNPLAIEREDLVKASVNFPQKAPSAIKVLGPDGKETPAQIVSRKENELKVLFLAKVPSVGFAVYDVRSADKPTAIKTGLSATHSSLENEYYRLTINTDGDVASIFDKRQKKELLAAPARLEFQNEHPSQWPAWNMDWKDRQLPPMDYVKGPAKVTVVENGPVRATLKIERTALNSVFTQYVSLAAGSAGERVEFKNDIDWQSRGVSLKAAFPLTVSNTNASYNLDMGVIERPTNEPKKYEVPSHQWFDLTDESGAYGVTILEDCKTGSDKPNNHTLRLTLLYTPKARSYQDQATQDIGRHEILYGLYGHKGDWREGLSEWQGRRLNQPLVAFVATQHQGPLGRTHSMLQVSTPQVDVRALKKAETSDYTIVRLQELFGKDAKNVTVSFAGKISDAYEADGQERKIGEATVKDGKLVLDMTKFSPRTFAVKLGKTSIPFAKPMRSMNTLPLQLNQDVISSDANRADGAFDARGASLPAEMLPDEIISEGIVFKLGDKTDGSKNAITCEGQRIVLPPGLFSEVHILAAATEDTKGVFKLGDVEHTLDIQNWTGYIGQWDNRIWDGNSTREITGLEPAYIKRDNVAWFATHRHHPQAGNEAYQFSYLFKYSLPFIMGNKTLTLPNNDKIKILAITLTPRSNSYVSPAQPLYDDFTDREPVELRPWIEEKKDYTKGRTPIGKVTLDRQRTFEALSMGAPVKDDYADANMENGVMATYVAGNELAQPHRSSGLNGRQAPRLNDGIVAQNNDDTSRCFWFDNGEGRILMDLQENVELDHINTYTWHRTNRAPQEFTLWGSNSQRRARGGVDLTQSNTWTLIAKVDSTKLGRGQIHGSTVSLEGAEQNEFRYLMWVTADLGEGAFFTELDIHPKK